VPLSLRISDSMTRNESALTWIAYSLLALLVWLCLFYSIHSAMRIAWNLLLIPFLFLAVWQICAAVALRWAWILWKHTNSMETLLWTVCAVFLAAMTGLIGVARVYGYLDWWNSAGLFITSFLTLTTVGLAGRFIIRRGRSEKNEDRPQL
jgi:hypothetical protein